MARLTDDGMLENVYRLQIMNGTEETQHYQLNVSGLKGLEIETEPAKNDKAKHSKYGEDSKHSKDGEDSKHSKDGEDSKHSKDGEDSKGNDHIKTIMVKPAEARWLIVDLKIPDGSVESGSHKIEFEIQAVESKETVKEKSIFLVPR
jgi:hypothetical protein